MQKPGYKSISPTLAALLGLASPGAYAADEAKTGSLPLWELGIGGAAYHQASYPGSDVRSTTAFPFPYVIYRGDWFRIDRSLQGILYETQKIKVDLSVGGTSVVDSDDSDARAGMPDLDPTFEAGPALSVLLTNPARPDSIWGRAAVRTAVSVDTGDWSFKQQGWVFDTRLRYQLPLLGETLKLSTEVGASFADNNYISYFYDVPSEYATPTRPAFESGSGYAGARLGLGLSGIYGKWRWSLFGAYMNFAGTPFENSPLLESNNDFSVGATIGWMFWQSKSRVTPKNTSPGGEFDTPLFGL